MRNGIGSELKRPRQYSYVLKFIGYFSSPLEEELQVQLKSAIFAGLTGTLVFLGAALVPLSVAANPASVRILLDLGDGAYIWSAETIADPEATNASWEAVQHAASANGISIEWGWHPLYGVGIFDLGDRNPPGGFVGIFEWNGTSKAWEQTLGISSLVLQDGDVIALYNAAFAPTPPYANRTPVPTPDHPQPSIEFRADATNSGLARSTIPDRIGLAWDRDLGDPEIGSTPAVAIGKVFVSTMRRMVALYADNGTVNWTNPKGKGFSSPAVYNNSVYVGTSSGTVVRMDAADGRLIWETRLLTSTSFTGISSSPKVAFDWVFIGTFNESGGPGEIVALWEGNGTIAWRHSTGSIHFSSPAYADGTVYVGVMGRYNTTTQISFDPPYGVLALDATTGEERWFFPTGGSVASSPALAGDAIVAPAKDGRVYAVNRTTGELLWQSDVDAGVSSPAVFGDRVYVGGGAFGTPGRVVALDLATGSERWSFTPNGPVQASLTYAGGRIVFSTNTDHGRVYALEAATGALTWSYEPSPSQYILGSPVVADGVIHAPSDNGHLYALADAGPDTTRPVIAISSPSPGSTLETTSVTVMGTASDDVAVLSVQLSTDGTTWVAASGTSAWSGTLTLQQGTNAIYARATDTSDNVAIVSIVVTVVIVVEGGGLGPFPLFVAILAAAVGIAMVVRLLVGRRRRRGL